MNRLAIYFVLVNLIFIVSCNQTSKETVVDKVKLDSLFSKLDEHHLGMGNVAISKNDRLVYQKAFGYALLNEPEKIPSATETFYRIGSVTKMFTAVLIFQLIDEGRLTLDDHLSNFFPEIPNADLITVRNLLNHSSGLANYSDTPDYQQWKYEKKSKKELLEIIVKSKTDFVPGNKHEYSNTNFLMLSLLLEKISGRSYQEMVKEKIFRKIDLHKTYYEESADTLRKESKSFKYFDGKWNRQRDDVAENHLGAGVLVSTPSDMITFVDALFSYKLIDKKSLDEMISFDKDYGLGIFKFQFGSSSAYGHEGRINEYYTTLIHFPDNGLSLAYCTNGILYPRDDIVNAVVQICLKNNYTLPVFSGSKANEKELTNLVGNYASDTMPINVTCKSENGELIVETQGRAFETTRISENYFANYQYGYFFEFQPTKNTLLIKETDNIYTLKKQ